MEAVYRQVEKDVDSMNALNIAQGNKWQFKADKAVEGSRMIITVMRHYSDDENRGMVRFDFKEWGINISRFLHDGWEVKQDKEGLLVNIVWDIEKGACEMLVDDEPNELWQVSQKALLPLFFNPNLD